MTRCRDFGGGRCHPPGVLGSVTVYRTGVGARVVTNLGNPVGLLAGSFDSSPPMVVGVSAGGDTRRGTRAAHFIIHRLTTSAGSPYEEPGS